MIKKISLLALLLTTTSLWGGIDKDKELYKAIQNGKLEGVIAALNTGANLDTSDHHIIGIDPTNPTIHRRIRQAPPIFPAVALGHVAIVQELLNRNANLLVTIPGDTPNFHIRWGISSLRLESLNIFDFMLSHWNLIENSPQHIQIVRMLIDHIAQTENIDTISSIGSLQTLLLREDDSTSEEDEEFKEEVIPAQQISRHPNSSRATQICQRAMQLGYNAAAATIFALSAYLVMQNLPQGDTK